MNNDEENYEGGSGDKKPNQREKVIYKNNSLQRSRSVERDRGNKNNTNPKPKSKDTVYK